MGTGTWNLFDLPRTSVPLASPLASLGLVLRPGALLET